MSYMLVIIIFNFKLKFIKIVLKACTELLYRELLLVNIFVMLFQVIIFINMLFDLPTKIGLFKP